jgi:predicted DNA-binding protein (MmcQ/YjbR family)
VERQKQREPRVSSHPVRVLSAADRRLVERVRKICRALPEANERISHGEPTWFAGKGKVFAMIDGHHHDSPHLSVWLPQPRDAQEALIDADPERFFRPPYVGVKGWVGIVLDTKPDWGIVARLVRESYLFVASAKLRKQLEDSPDARRA